MAITSMSGYRAALRESPPWTKTPVRNPTQDGWNTLWDATGVPAAGSLTINNSTSGIVPNDGTVGAPLIAFTRRAEWSATDRQPTAQYLLSNGNLTITGVAGDGFPGARGTIGCTTGKYYFEVLATTVNGGTNSPATGVASGAWGESAIDNNVWAIQSTPSFYRDGANGSFASGVTYVNGDIYQVAVDFDAHKIWYGRNNTWILSGNPAAGTNSQSTTLPSTILYPMARVSGSPCLVTARFKSADWTYAAPSGFSAWPEADGDRLGYLTSVELSSVLTTTGTARGGRYMLYDRLFHAGAYPFNAAVVLASQPSYASRVPGGSYAGLRIWFETVSNFTGNPTVTVTYTNEAGATGHTATFALGGAPTVGYMFELPLQAGDYGVQKIESVTGTIATVGTFNIIVMRRLFREHYGHRPLNGTPPRQWMDRLGMPQIFGDSCLAALQYWDGSTASLTVDLNIEVSSS